MLAAALTFAALLAGACSSGEKAAVESDEGAETEEDSSSGSVVSGGFASGPAGIEFFESLSGASSAPGLTASGSASSLVPADRAVVVVQTEPRGSFLALGGGQLPAEDRTAVIQAVEGLGIPSEAVSFSRPGGYGLPRVQVAVPAAAVATTGQRVVDAVERVLGRAQNQGVVFFAADCAAAVSGLQKQASRMPKERRASWRRTVPSGWGRSPR